MLSYDPHLAHLGKSLRQAFPDPPALEPLHVLGEGFGSIVVETGAGLVFRIAKNQAVAARHAREVRLLSLLNAYVPVAVPNPRWHAVASPDFPFGVMGYAKLPGTPLHPRMLTALNPQQLATDIAQFLLALHRFPIREAEAIGLPGPTAQRREWTILRDDVLPPLRAALTEREYRMVERWWEDFLADPVLQRCTPVLQHGDLWYENMLVDTEAGKLVGVVDFEAAAIGDPAQDFATQLYFGEQFVADVIAAYRSAGGVLDPDFGHRMRKLWELRDFGGVQFAVRFDDVAELEDSIRKIRQGPIFV